MDAAFHFELGVFKEEFVPTTDNKELWARNWVAAQRTAYITGSKSFSSQFTLENNDTPFTSWKNAYVWGFRGDASGGEWILFREESWSWPIYTSGNLDPTLLNWNAANATPIVGTIHPTGTLFLMQSAAVTNAAPPTTTWEQWQADSLSDEPFDGPDDDPDKDGVSNLLEFIFDTPPKTAGPPTQTPVTLVDGHLRIAIPRRIDHKATLVVEVSSDLANWNSGTDETEVVSDGLTTLVVRDKTPFAPSLTRRFMRLRASLP